MAALSKGPRRSRPATRVVQSPEYVERDGRPDCDNRRFRVVVRLPRVAANQGLRPHEHLHLVPRFLYLCAAARALVSQVLPGEVTEDILLHSDIATNHRRRTR